MSQWHPAPKQTQQFEDNGYFVQRNIIQRDLAIKLRSSHGWVHHRSASVPGQDRHFRRQHA